jgi:hypothetical protein
MNIRHLLPHLVCCALPLVLSACGKSTTATSEGDVDTPNAANAVGGDTVEALPMPELAPIGIEACDHVMAKQLACVAKQPASGQAVLLPPMVETHRQWTRMASSKDLRPMVASMCEQVLEAISKPGALDGC